MKIECLYFDGLQTKEYSYTLDIESDILVLTDPQTNQKKVFWSVDEIKIVQEPTPTTPGKISSKSSPDARIIIASSHDWKKFIDALPASSKHMEWVSMKWRAMPFYVILSIVCLFIIIKATPELMQKAVIFVPQSVEKKIGDNYVEMISEKGVCESEAGNKALGKIINTIKQYPELSDVDLKVTVIDQDIKNAFAFPGRSIVIFKGLIETAKTPEELAFIIAHETGHISERHAMKGYLQSQGLSLLINIMVGNMSPAGNSLPEIAGTFGNLHNVRHYEDDADAFALSVSQHINMDHRDGAAFFERIAKKEKAYAFIPKWLSTHPETKQRIKKIKEFRSDETVEYTPILNEEEWQSLQSICQ